MSLDVAGQTTRRRPAPSLLYVIKQLELAVRSHLDDIVKAAGITALQYTALTVLDHHDGLSLAQLARDSFVTPQSVADLVANLERGGLVRRDRNPRSRRELIVSLTAAGRALKKRALPVPEQLLCASGCSIGEITALTRRLQKLRGALAQSAAA